MSDLAEFLLARIAEDMTAVNDRTRHLTPGGWSYLEQFGDFGDDERWMIEIPAARVLAECGAKRRIVEQYADYLSTVRAYRSPRWSDAMNEQDKQNARQAEARHRVAEEVAQLLAVPYADHPDYREEWRP